MGAELCVWRHPVETCSNLGVLLGLGQLLQIPVEVAAGALLIEGLLEIGHHSNVRTPPRLRWLAGMIQLPEMHLIHHQMGVHRYNYSPIALWDWLFGTARIPTDWHFEYPLGLRSWGDWRRLIWWRKRCGQLDVDYFHRPPYDSSFRAEEDKTMANNHFADRELNALLRNARAQGFLVGIDELAPALRANLVELKQGRDIGLRDPDGEPVRSLRGFARLMGNESAYSYLSKFASKNAMPCITIMNQVTNTMGIRYLVMNFDDRHYRPVLPQPAVGPDQVREIRVEA